MEEHSTGKVPTAVQLMKAASVHYRQAGVTEQVILRISVQLQGSGHHLYVEIMHGSGSSITILPKYTVVPRVFMRAFQYVASRMNAEHYSLVTVFTGFACAAFIEMKLIVTRATTSVINSDTTNGTTVLHTNGDNPNFM
jgi:hypothetical protein